MFGRFRIRTSTSDLGGPRTRSELFPPAQCAVGSVDSRDSGMPDLGMKSPLYEEKCVDALLMSEALHASCHSCGQQVTGAQTRGSLTGCRDSESDLFYSEAVAAVGRVPKKLHDDVPGASLPGLGPRRLAACHNSWRSGVCTSWSRMCRRWSAQRFASSVVSLSPSAPRAATNRSTSARIAACCLFIQ